MKRVLPPISIVVIGRNEGPRLARCFESVRAADYPAAKIELIYVDSASSDGSCEVASAYGAAVVRLNAGVMNAARARNAGLTRANNELVQFLDGDSELEPGWLRLAIAAMDDPRIVAVFGRLEELHPRQSIYMKAISSTWTIAAAGPAPYCGGNAMLRRSALTRSGGFREDLHAGEEPELCYRLRRAGGIIWHLDEPMARHDLDMTRFGQYWRRAVRSGWALAVVGLMCRHGPQRVWLRENLVPLAEWLLWLAAIVAAIAFSPAALLIVLMLPLLRLAWITARVRSRFSGWGDALLYAGHCLFSRLPVAIGQVQGALYLAGARCRKRAHRAPPGWPSGRDSRPYPTGQDLIA